MYCIGSLNFSNKNIAIAGKSIISASQTSPDNMALNIKEMNIAIKIDKINSIVSDKQLHFRYFGGSVILFHTGIVS